MLNPYINSLNSRLRAGRLNEVTYANILKNYYDSNAAFLDQDSLNYVESKLTELKIPIASQDATDGVIKQAVSGLLEGFTTFGFADKPDTGMEKIVNNVTHLIGLAPGIMMGGARMLTSATATVGNAIIRRGAAESSKSLAKLGKKLVDKSNNYAASSDRLQRSMGRLANTTLLKPLRSTNPVMLDPVKNKSIYELKSIPGKIAEVVQMQGIAALGENKGKLLEGISSGLLLGGMSKDAVGRILHEAGHVGLLMAFSNHPLASRNTGGMSGEGIKEMAMAGMHGGIAGGIFGSIGQYANISKLMTSSNPALVKAGESIIRKTASTLATKNTAEATEFINTVVRGTAGAGYGGIVAAMNDYPVEEQIYETLMGVFFSVNARPTWQTRATKDINVHANTFDRTKSVRENIDTLKRLPWFKSETKDYQQYWLNHFEAIRQQQLTSKEVITDQLGLEILKVVQQLEKNGKITQEQIQYALKGKGKEEGKLGLLQELVKLKERVQSDNYTPDVDIAPYKPSKNIDLSLLNESFRKELTSGNEVDFPVHSLTQIAKRIADTSGYEKFTQEMFFEKMVTAFNTTKAKHFYKDSKGKERIDVDEFVKKVKRQYPKVKFDSNDIKETRRVALRFDNYKPIYDDFYIDFTNPLKSGDKKTVGDPQMVPMVDPQGNPLSKLTAGKRDTFIGFRNMRGKTISYMQVNKGKKNVIFVSPFARETVYSPKSKNPIVRPYVSEKDWYAFEKKLNERDREFIYGGISDTGRVDIRSYPWAAKGKQGHWTPTEVEGVYKKIIKEAIKTPEGLAWYRANSKKQINKETKENTVATMIYRMREMGMIKSGKDVNVKKITGLVERYLRNEKNGDYKTPAKFQKYLNQMDKAEIPFLDGLKLGLKNNDMNGILLEDLNVGTRFESETDGTILLNSRIFDKLVKYMGNDSASGMAKGTLFSKPRTSREKARNDQGSRSLVIGKFAYARADKADMRYMDANNLQFMLYTSGAKHKFGLEVNMLNELAYDKSKATIDQNVYPIDPKKFNVKTSDFHWNIDVREKINVTGKLNIMQQMFLNANNIQFDPNTPVGEAFHQGWRGLLSDAVRGDSKVTKEALKRLDQKTHKGKKLKGGRDLEGLDIDKIDIATIDTIMTTRTKSQAFKSILKHLYFENKHGQFLDTEASEFSRVHDKHVGQHLADTGFSYSALQSRGTSEFVQKTLRSYLLARIIRPKVNNSYSVILAPYDWKYSLKKQKYSSAEKGLADNEFMLWSGAENMRVKHPTEGKEITLKQWWTDMQNVLSLNMNNAKVAKMSAEDLTAWRDSQYAIINRSPVMTAGNMRALKFVGFAGGKSKKGFALITNSRNDLMMGGADKDIDSAHLSWGMPKGIKDGYRQPHVQYEFSKKENIKEDYELKDDQFLMDRGIIGDVVAKPNSLGILMLGEKIKAADSATYGKDSIGIIFNGFTQIKQAAELALQSRADLSPKEKLEIWQEIARLNSAIGNRYIDAAETVGLPDAFTTMRKVREYLENTYELPVSELDVSQFKKFHDATIKGKLKKDGPTYDKISKNMIDKHGDVDSIVRQIAEYTKDLNMTIDPLVNMKKENMFNIVGMLNEALSKDPYAKAFGIENDKYFKNIFFDPKSTTKSEVEAILDNPHFLYNKMSVVRVVKAVQETYNFLDKPHKGLNDSSISETLTKRFRMTRPEIDSFVYQLIHTAQQQKFMFSGRANAKLQKFAAGSRNNPDGMSYPETVLLSKRYLKQALTEFYAKKATRGGRGTIPKSEMTIINKQVEKLFEYWHEANPFMELNYNGMPQEQKAAFEVRKQEVIRVRDKLRNLVLYKEGKKNKGTRKNENDWSEKDKSNYYNLRQQLGNYEYEMRNFQPEGPNNMMRNAAISPEVKRDIARFEESILESLKEPTETRRRSAIFKTTTLQEPVKTGDRDGPGTVIDKDIKFGGTFAADLTNWEALAKADNFKKEIASQIKTKQEIVDKYQMTPKALTYEIDRMGNIIKRMALNGQTSHVMDLTGIYLKTFEKLDVAAKSGIDTIDYNHLRIFSNILENRYLDGWKEWGTRKLLHRKLIKEIAELEKKHGSKLMPPEFDTDLLFPSEIGKILEKVDKVYNIGTAQVIKDGIYTDVGIKYPTNIVSEIGKTIGSAHTAGNVLADIMIAELNSKLDTIRPVNYKEYAKVKPILESLAAYERQMGLKGNEKPGDRGPRENESPQSIANLKANVIKFRKLLSEIDPKYRIEVKERGTDKDLELTPREMVEYIKETIQTETMTDAYNTLHASNYKTLAEMLSGKKLVQGRFKGGVFNFDKFYDVDIKNKLSVDQPEYMHKAMSETFMDVHGIIMPDRLLFIESVNLNDRRLAQGKEVVRKHFHSEDLTWAEFQLDIRDIAIEKYGTVLKDGSVGLDYSKLQKTISETNPKMTKYQELQSFIKETNLNKVRDQRLGFIGTEEVDGERFSNTYHPLHHPNTKAHIKFIQNEHIPRETLRYFGKLQNTVTKEYYYEFKDIDIEAFKRGEVVGRYDTKLGLKEGELLTENLELHRALEQKFITLPEVAERLYKNMVNKLVNNPEQYNNEFYDQVSYDRINMISTRRGSIEAPGVGKFSTIRKRASVPIEGYDTSMEAYKRYLRTSALGVTTQRAALMSRLHISHFKYNTLPGNKRIDPDVGRRWLHKIIDLTKGYMNMPSTRSLELNGVNAKDMDILVKYAESGYSLHFLKENPMYDAVDAKLINDLRQYTRPSESEINNMQKELYAKYRFKNIKDAYGNNIEKINKSKASQADKKTARINLTKKYEDTVKSKRKAMLRELYGEFVNVDGKVIQRNNIDLIDYAENMVVLKSGKGVKFDKRSSTIGAIRKRTVDYRNDFIFKNNTKEINKDNIDITNIRKSFRGFYSDETVGNVMVRAEQRVNKALGHLTDGRIQIFKSLPKDPTARHRAMVDKMNWFSDMEGKFEMMALLAHPKSAVANMYGGTTNLITDVGFDFYLKSFDENYLVNTVFKGKTINAYDPSTRQYIKDPIRTIDDVHTYVESFGFLESNIVRELAMMKPAGETDWQSFVNVAGPRIAEAFKKLPVYTKDKSLNKENIEKRKQTVEQELTISEASKKFGINKVALDMGSYFMRTTERHLRLKSAIAHYIKARELFTDSRGQVEVTEQFLLEYAQKGIESSQFIYHATNRPNFANTAFGRVMTRFHPYSWNSIRRRANIISDRMLTEGYGDFDANKKFERQLSADLMTAALGSVFAASIFEYALSPPMNWMVDFSHLMYGDEQERERAFYNQYGHPLLSPLAIVTPPAARFVLGPTTSIINNDWEAFAKYTAATALPFGRVGRDFLRTAETPEMAMEWMFGIPVHAVGRLGNRPDKEENEEIVEEAP